MTSNCTHLHIFISIVQECFIENYENAKFLIFLIFYPINLHQIFTVLFKMLYSLYWINLNLDWISPLNDRQEQLKVWFFTRIGTLGVKLLPNLPAGWAFPEEFFTGDAVFTGDLASFVLSTIWTKMWKRIKIFFFFCFANNWPHASYTWRN